MDYHKKLLEWRIFHLQRIAERNEPTVQTIEENAEELNQLTEVFDKLNKATQPTPMTMEEILKKTGWQLGEKAYDWHQQIGEEEYFLNIEKSGKIWIFTQDQDGDVFDIFWGHLTSNDKLSEFQTIMNQTILFDKA